MTGLANSVKKIITGLLIVGLLLTFVILSRQQIYCVGCTNISITTPVVSGSYSGTGMTSAEVFLLGLVWAIVLLLSLFMVLFQKQIAKLLNRYSK